MSRIYDCVGFLQIRSHFNEKVMAIISECEEIYSICYKILYVRISYVCIYIRIRIGLL